MSGECSSMRGEGLYHCFTCQTLRTELLTELDVCLYILECRTMHMFQMLCYGIGES